MSATMIFGSMVAGATSEGGASIAFPVMNCLAMDVKPHVGPHFRITLQSVGMTSDPRDSLHASARGLKSITYCSLGGALWCDFRVRTGRPTLTPPYARRGAAVCWAGSFAARPGILNRHPWAEGLRLVVDPKHLPEIWALGDLTPTGRSTCC